MSPDSSQHVTRRLSVEHGADSCYFRSSAETGARKALVQITERCNLHCAHCFVSATRNGSDISLDQMRASVLPRLQRAGVNRLTLTGGEPFVHPEILDITCAASEIGMKVGICTNATCIDDATIEALTGIDDVHVNVSFDGFRRSSHGRFRGDPASFDVTVETTRKLAEAGLLQGLLSTPNSLTDEEDYRALARFAVETGATYLLMNPLSAFGRGVKSQSRLAHSTSAMRMIRRAVEVESNGMVEIVPIRFPNDAKPLAGCIAGEIIYVFADGAVAACPYLVFASRSPASLYPDHEFIVGNVFDQEIAANLRNYAFHERYTVGANATCGSCALDSACGKGCPAAVIAGGGAIGDRDTEVCPLP